MSTDPSGTARTSAAISEVDLLPRPRAIIFDWDNTLVDSWSTIHEALNHVMAAMGKPEWSLADTKGRVRLSLRESFPLHFGERWEEARGIYLDKFRAIHLERLSSLPGREALLAELAREGIFLAVVSNKTGELLRREVEQIGWSRYFGAVIGAGDATADKPACEPVHMALQRSGVPAGSDVWFVGDTEVDMQCALNAGCIPVLLGTYAADEPFVEFLPRLIVASEPPVFRWRQEL